MFRVGVKVVWDGDGDGGDGDVEGGGLGFGRVKAYLMDMKHYRCKKTKYSNISVVLHFLHAPHTTPPRPHTTLHTHTQGLKGRVTAVSHNPSQPHVLACGMEAGDVVVFDLRSNEVRQAIHGWS